jgi:hypothetical protein
MNVAQFHRDTRLRGSARAKQSTTVNHRNARIVPATGVAHYGIATHPQSILVGPLVGIGHRSDGRHDVLPLAPAACGIASVAACCTGQRLCPTLVGSESPIVLGVAQV